MSTKPIASTTPTTSSPPTKIAIALFNRVTMLDAIGLYSVLCDLPDAEVTFVAENAGQSPTLVAACP